MKTLIFTLITLSFSLSYAGRIDHYYREVAKTGKIHRPHRMGIIKTLRIKLGLEQRLFHKAVRQGDLTKVKDFLNRPEIDPNASISPHRNEPPLLLAVIRGEKPMVELLLTHPRIDPNIKVTHGYTLLYKAAMAGRVDIVEALLNHSKTDPNVKSPPGYTPLHAVAVKGDLPVVEALLRHPDINSHARHGDILMHESWRKDALEMASARGHKEIVEAIQNHQNRERKTPHNH